MKTYSVTILPEEKTLLAAEGKSLLEIAKLAGVPINGICGGEGVCGKCRVNVKSGKVTAEPNMFLTRREIQRGGALACQTYIGGDVVVEVPLESRVGGVPQFASEDAIRFGGVSTSIGEGARFLHRPLAHKVHLKIDPPSLTDNICDQDRLFRQVRKHRDIPVMQAGLSVLRKLSGMMRDNEWEITATLGSRGDTVEIVDIEPRDTSQVNYGVAVDIGTTTVVAHLVDLATSETVATKARYNSQLAFGDDVISRIAAASSDTKRDEMRQVLVDDINDLITGVVVDADIRLNDITYVMCAGNTSMTHFLFGLDAGNIRREPYIPCASRPPTIRAAEIGIGINTRGLLGAVPSVACYVGGDIVADVLVSDMTESEELSLLIDLGTNGELVLGNSDWMLCCSASAGPAFEGGGIACGMRATKGAIEKISLTDTGDIDGCHVVGGDKPLGLCGSGLIDAVAELLRVGCLDRTGRFVSVRCGNHLRTDDDGQEEFVLVPGEDTALGREIYLTRSDISNLMHSKGSIFMAADCLLDHVGMTFDDLDHVYIAGGFGNYLRIEAAVAIGLMPDVPRERFSFMGNGSVQGAKMALLSDEALKYTCDRIAGHMTYIDLSSNHKYMNEYSSCLFLPHTDLDRFPSLGAAGRSDGGT